METQFFVYTHQCIIKDLVCTPSCGRVDDIPGPSVSSAGSGTRVWLMTELVSERAGCDTIVTPANMFSVGTELLKRHEQ